MTLANLIVQPERAYLITDSGAYSKDGSIVALHSKTLRIPSLSLAVAATGELQTGGLARAFQRWLIAEGKTRCDLAEFVGALPSVVRRACAVYGIDPDKHCQSLFVALYSPEHGGAFGLMMRTARRADGASHLEPWKLHPVPSLLHPGVDLGAALGRNVDLGDPLAFDPMTDSMPLVEAQRKVRFPPVGDFAPMRAVAGKIEVTAVSRDGIETTTLHTYPDEIGQLAGAELAMAES